jgi:hypothetical protein
MLAARPRMSHAIGDEPSDRGRIQSCPLTRTLRPAIAMPWLGLEGAAGAEYTLGQANDKGVEAGKRGGPRPRDFAAKAGPYD